MKKMMIAAAILAMSATMGLSAQNNKGNCPQQACAPAQCDTTSCLPGCGPGVCAPDYCFEGLNLTDTQKSQIKELRTKKQADRAAKREAKQAKKAEKRAAREADRKAYLAELKGILTPEQYVQYLENSFTKGKIAKQAKRPGKGGKDMRKGGPRKGQPGQGGQRGQRPAPQNGGQK